MKVSIFFNGSYPSAGASSNRVKNYALGLENSGAEVSVISTPFVSTGYVMIRLERFLTPFKILPKVINERNQANIIFSYGHSWITIVVMKICLLFSNSRIVMEVCEKPCSTYASWFYELYPVKKVNLIGTKHIVFKIVDGFVVISHALENYVARLKSPSAEIIHIPILVDNKRYNNRRTFNQKYVLKKPYILHSGLVSERKDGIVSVIEAFARVCKKRDKNLFFYFTLEAGPIEDIKKIKKIVSDYSLEENVQFLGELKPNELLEVQRNCLLTVINKPVNEQNRYNFPTKLGEYLSLGKPVVASQFGEMKNHLEDEVSAFLLPDNSPESIAKKIEQVLDNPGQVKIVSDNARRLALQEFDCMVNGKKLFHFFKNMC